MLNLGNVFFILAQEIPEEDIFSILEELLKRGNIILVIITAIVASILTIFKLYKRQETQEDKNNKETTFFDHIKILMEVNEKFRESLTKELNDTKLEIASLKDKISQKEKIIEKCYNEINELKDKYHAKCLEIKLSEQKIKNLEDLIETLKNRLNKKFTD